MTDQISFPPLLDVSPGELEVQKQHLLSEITREREKTRLSLPGIPRLRPRFVVPAVAVIGAAAIAVALVSTSGGGSPGGTVAAPVAPLYAFHASLSSTVRANHFYGYEPSFANLTGAKARHGVPALVSAWARREAAVNGDRHPLRGEWIKTRRQRAVSSQSADRVDGGQRLVYFVVLHGHFVDRNAYYLSRGKKGSSTGAPHGTFLTFTIDAKRGAILDFALANGAPSFSKLGTPTRFTISPGRTR